MPSPLHRKIQKYAMNSLLNEGFSNIYDEYPVLIPTDGSETKFIVDVVAIKEDRKIAVEIISVEYSKLKLLEKYFDEVRHITISDYVELLETEIKKLKKEIKKNKKKQKTESPIITISEHPQIKKEITILKKLGSKLIRRQETGYIIKQSGLHATVSIPYKNLIDVLEKDGEAFLEADKENPLRRQTVWKAAKLLSLRMGKTVRYDRSLLRIDGVGALEGYAFSIEGDQRSQSPPDNAS